MATRYVVNALFGSTTLPLAISARRPEDAAAKAAKDKMGRKALAFIVIERASGQTKFIRPNGV